MTFGVYLGVQWWAERNADGGEYLGQRMFAARSAQDAQWGTLWFAIWEFALKSWPIIITALASLVLLPDIGHEDAYPQMISRYLPVGLRGLVVASLLAAFMSTLDTHLNWGASYLVNDFYKRFARPNESEKHYIRVSRIAMLAIAGAAALASLMMTSITEAWMLLLALGSGLGLVKLLRWYWWRINAWTELSAMAASAVMTLIMFRLQPILEWMYPGSDYSFVSSREFYGYRLISIVVGSAVVWIAVTFLTAPVPLAQLKIFYERVQPRGGFWGPIAKPEHNKFFVGSDLMAWFMGIVFVYAMTVGVGKFVLGFWTEGVVGIALSLVAGMATIRLLKAQDSER